MLGRCRHFLRARGQRPFVELFGNLQIARALDQAHRTDLGTGAIGRRDGLDRKALHLLARAVVHKADRHRGFATRHGLDRRSARAGVLTDVAVQGLHVIKGLVFAHQLHQRGHHGVGGAARCRVGHLDLAAVFGLEQVGPGARHWQLLAREQFGVVAKPQRSRVDAHGAPARLLRLLLRPRVQLRQRGRLVFERQPLFSGLQMRIAGAAEPQVGTRVVAFGDQLRQRLARALEQHVDLHAGGAAVDGGNRAAPFGLHRADHIDLPLGLRGRSQCQPCEQRSAEKSLACQP